MRTLLATALTVGLAGMLAPLVSPSPASAASSDCPSGQFCIWNPINFTGWDYIRPTGLSSTQNSNFNYVNFNDVASSAVNKSIYRWCLYEHANYSGNYLVFPPNTQISDFRAYGWNDRASSTKVC
ncbi:peptidase inhibitor family I36 protein [Micromonospora sp. NPDC048830]|uniref:peptidase inhibitor family I36 protein n=1 Tax=Micromonospora sp. NPDC048830 TaxID=3364257 RepID=UPI0037207888